MNVEDVVRFIEQSKTIHGLQRIRSKVNKRIKAWPWKSQESPYTHIPIEKKKEVLKDLFV